MERAYVSIDIILIFQAIFVYGHVTEGSSTGLPPSGQIIGWVMAAIAIGQVLLWMIIAFIRAPGYNAREVWFEMFGFLDISGELGMKEK